MLVRWLGEISPARRDIWLCWRAVRAIPVRAGGIAAALVLSALALLFPPTTLAQHNRPPPPPPPTSPYGNDISYPQCGTQFPTGPTFGLVGVDDGIANKANPCLGPYNGGAGTSELYWGSRLPGNSSQPPVALYVNTADPSNTYKRQPIADWPKPGSTVQGLTNPYGQCLADPSNSSLGADSTGCAWVYGANIASLDASSGPPLTGTAPTSFLTSASDALQAAGASVSGNASSYQWWLDVETANTWQSGSANALAMNDAVLEGMLQYLKSLSVTVVGIYASSGGWQTITGGQSTIESNWTAAGNPAPSPLHAVPDWLPGATSQSGAISNCSTTSFTGGRIDLAQWVQNSLDYNQSC
jgi:hypothetical protein